jgi:hypothetical protein
MASTLDKNVDSYTRIVRYKDGNAALEVDKESAVLAAGNHHIQAYSGSGGLDRGGVSIASSNINLFALPQNIRIAGILTLNPMAFLPGFNTFKIALPTPSVSALSSMVKIYSDLIAPVAGSLGAG